MTTKSKTPSVADLKFSGFTRPGLTFLSELKQNNDREWFRERKHIYETELRAPMEALVHQSAARCRRAGIPLSPKEKNPLTRIYRDIRFSADKTPFHTHVGAALKGLTSVGRIGEVYIHISPEEKFAAAGFWMPERPFLQVWRERMVSKPELFKSVLAKLKRRNLDWLRYHSLKKLPRGFQAQAGSELEDYLKLQVYVVRKTFTEEEVMSGELVDAVAEVAVGAKPLLEFGWSLNHSRKRDILELD
jgi:uncharacterized protein (TIGR02453 family)